MKKQVFFTVDGRQSEERNGINVYQNFQYDTTTKELKFVDYFNGQKKEFSLGTATLVEDATSGATTEPQSTDPENP